MITLRAYKPDDAAIVAYMFHDLLKEAYPLREIRGLLPCEIVVKAWYANGFDIVVAVNEYDTPIGYTVSYLDDNFGTTETIYNADSIYVLPEYRKSRAAYLLYHNIDKRSRELGLGVETHSNPQSAPILAKRFNMQISFTTFGRDTSNY